MMLVVMVAAAAAAGLNRTDAAPMNMDNSASLRR